MSFLRRVFLVAVFGVLIAGGAAASPGDEARAYHEKAKAAFALEKYGQAAEYFEHAFELKADPAILYNAALSHRLAGDKERALRLYQNYLRVFGHVGKWTEVEARVEELKKAVATEHASTGAPPASAELPKGGMPETTPSGPARTELPPGANPAATPGTTPPRAAPPSPVAQGPGVAAGPLLAPPPAEPPPASGAPALVAGPSDAQGGPSEPLTHRPLFWVGVGGVMAAVAGAVVVTLMLRTTKDPTATLGGLMSN